MAKPDTSNEPDTAPIPEMESAESRATDAGSFEAEVESQRPDHGPGQSRRNAGRRGLSVLLGLVLGGVLAAGTGFYAARYVVPEGWPFPGVTPEPNPIAIEQNAQADRLAALEFQLTEQGDALLRLQRNTTAQTIAEKATADLAIAEAKLAEMQALVSALDTRLSEVEKIPEGSGTEVAEIAAAAYERELSAMRDMLAGELARIEAAGSDARAAEVLAETTAQIATAQAALANVRGALDSGQPFQDALQEINVDIPAGLLSVAEIGVPTLPTLQDAFPPAARSALDVSIQAAIDDGTIGHIAGFFQRQLGTRSLEPQEGDGPDAILSRAEAALKTGDIATALQEIGDLPEIGRTEMADWRALAQQRLDALTAIETLTMLVNAE